MDLGIVEPHALQQKELQERQSFSLSPDPPLGDPEAQHLCQRLEHVAASLLFSLSSIRMNFLTLSQQEVVAYSIRTLQELLQSSGKPPPPPLMNQELPRIEFLTGTVALLSYLYHQLQTHCQYRTGMASLADNLKQNPKSYAESCEAYVHNWIRNGLHPAQATSPPQAAPRSNFNVVERLTEHFETSQESPDNLSPKDKKQDRNVLFTTPTKELNVCMTNTSPSSVTTCDPTSKSTSFPMAQFASCVQEFPIAAKKRDVELMPPPASTPDTVQEDAEKLRAKQRHNKIASTQRLILSLYHSSRCTNDPDLPCLISRYCSYHKGLWEHMSAGGCCRDGPCKVPRCREAKHALNHFRNCQLADCDVCVPVKMAIPKLKRDMAIATEATKRNAQSSKNPSKSSPVLSVEKTQESTSSCCADRQTGHKSVPLKKRPVAENGSAKVAMGWISPKEQIPVVPMINGHAGTSPGSAIQISDDDVSKQ